MPQKKAKKPVAKPAASKVKKPAKSGKNEGFGAALKKAAKNVAHTVGLSGSKKVVPPKKAAASASAAKVEKPGKKIEASKKIIPAAKAQKEAPTLAVVKGKKEEAPKIVKGKAAKGKEVVVEVPAPKGVALLAKDGKTKKSKAAEAAAQARARRCREPGCEHEFILLGYCRLHYIKNWRRIKRKEAILGSGQLNNYVEELVNKYPDKYLDVIRQDLASEKEWGKVVVDLELESADEEGAGDEDIDTVAEGVRPAAGSGRGEFDDEGDAF